jgi:hypothetical protein
LPERTSSSERLALGLWICAPWLGLVLVWLAASNLPGSHCEGEPVADASQKAVLITVTVLVSLSILLGVALRLSALWRRGHWALSGRPLGILLAVVVTLLAGALLALSTLDNSVGVVLYVTFYVGALATAVCLLALFVGWVVGRSTDDVGLLLPIYLLAAALVIYPALTVLALAAESGAFC